MYSPDEAMKFIKKARQIPPNVAVKITESAGILNATLYLYILLNEHESACALIKNALESDLMEFCDKTAKDVASFLSEIENSKELWFSALPAFQLPLAANAEKTIPTLINFVQSMTQVVDNVEISQQLVKMMSFLPFSITRPVFRQFFNISKERGQFGMAFAQIKHNEAVANSLNCVRRSSKGMLIDASICRSCMKQLSGHVVVCGNCGRCYHASCVHGWCENCARVINSHFERDEPAMKRLQKFEQLEENGLRKVNAPQKLKRERASPLPSPSIGFSVTKL